MMRVMTDKNLNSKIQAWLNLKNKALKLFGKDSVEYILAETQLDFLLKENDLEITKLTIGFVKKNN
jgi:hypothetical protein